MTFFLKTEQGYAFKVLVDLLHNTIKYPCFTISERGVELRSLDYYQRLLVDLFLPAENFLEFRCDKPVTFGITSTYLQNLVKTVKRRNILTMEITDEDVSKLTVHVTPKDLSSTMSASLKIQHIQMIEVDLFEGYSYPIHIPSSEYQKMIKSLSSMEAKVVEITIKDDKQINFYCNAENVYDKSFTFGQDTTGENEYKMTFDINQLNRLSKLSCIGGTSSYIKIFSQKDYPLKFLVNVGTLGTLGIYIKSNEVIEEDERVN